MIRPVALILLASIALSGCGRRVPLQPAPGKSLPIKAEGAPQTPTPEELMMPSTQAQPKRSDEQLKRSEERRDDKFDLPPEG
jgi:hypothetical protein